MEEAVLSKFKAFDQNGDGLIQLAELEYVMQQLDSKRWTDRQISLLFKVLDSDKSGYVDYGEFIYWALSDRPAPAPFVMRGLRDEIRQFQARPFSTNEVESYSAKINNIKASKLNKMQCMQQELDAKREMLERKLKEHQELIQVVEQQKALLPGYLSEKEAIRQDIAILSEECKALNVKAKVDDDERVRSSLDTFQTELDKLPDRLRDHLADLGTVTKRKDEMGPAPFARNIASAVMILMDRSSNWESFVDFMNQPKVESRLQHFDWQGVPDRILRKLEPYTQKPDFTPEIAAKTGPVQAVLCRFVLTMKHCAEIYREKEPQRLELRNAQDKLEKAHRDLEDHEKKQKQTEDMIKQLEDHTNATLADTRSIGDSVARLRSLLNGYHMS